MNETELMSLARGYAEGLVTLEMLEDELEDTEIDLVLLFAERYRETLGS